MLSVLKQIKEALLTVTPNVFHYEAYAIDDKYVVWAEQGESDSFYADNGKRERTIQGSIDYYTKDDDDSIPDGIEAALMTAGIIFSLNSVQYEDETKFIHYEWLFEVM